MTKTTRTTTKTASAASRKRGIVKARYVLTLAVILCAIVVGVLASMGPKLGLQTAPIEPEAMTYLTKHNLIQADETIQAFKAISYYTYNQGAVITDKRLFVYDHNTSHSIPLSAISMVIVKNSELGHQEVIIAAQQNGVIGLELYHTYVPTLLKLLNVPSSKVQDVTGGARPAAK